jgi:hypothetical protein
MEGEAHFYAWGMGMLQEFQVGKNLIYIHRRLEEF